MIYPSMIDIEADKIIRAITKIRFISIAMSINFLLATILIYGFVRLFSLFTTPDLW
jgi:ACR3 family arsenite efflux pump ArsB